MSMKHGIVCTSFYARHVRRGYGVLIGDSPMQRSFTRLQKKGAEYHDTYIFPSRSGASMHSNIFREITLATRAFSEMIAEKRCNRGGHYKTTVKVRQCF